MRASLDSRRTLLAALLALSCALLFAGEGESSPLLLMDYHKARPSNLSGYVMSEKLDGVRALWNGKQLRSRSGREILAPACFLQHFPPFALDGELWLGRGQFSSVAAIVQRACYDCACWEGVGYYVFDVPDCARESKRESRGESSLDSSGEKPCDLLERLGALESYLSSAPAGRISLIKQEEIPSEEALFARLRELSKQGAEGLVVRKVRAPYEAGRSPNALKLKLYDDAECRVVEHHVGRGKYARVLGALSCEQEVLKPDGRTESIRFKIGSGFSDKERANPPPLGTLITYRFQGYTKNGVPRFAVFHRIYENP